MGNTIRHFAVALLVTGCAGDIGPESDGPDGGLEGDPGDLDEAAAGAGWRTTPLYGGGYNTVIEYNPLDPASVLLGTDIGGLHISRDGGVTWSTRARGGVAPNGSRIASVAWHPTKVDVAYALVGDCNPGSGGLLVSVDRGWSWTLSSSLPVGCGNHTTPLGTTLPFPHPRSIGSLIAVDAAGGFIYVGTASQGVMRAAIAADGRPGAFSVVALAPSGGRFYYVRSLVRDSVDPTVLYAATHTASLALGTGRPLRITSARTTPVATELSGAPRDVEELVSLDGHLYGVANDAGGAGVGVFRLPAARTQAASTAWRNIQGPRYDVGVKWYSLAARREGSVTTLWLATHGTWRPSSTVAWKFLWRGRSSDGFATNGTWTAFPDAIADTPNDVAGPQVTASPDTWWKLAESNYCWPGKDSGFTAGDFALHPSNASQLMFAGQCGPWRTLDDGDTWHPMPNGINLLADVRIAADPKQAGRVAIGNVDYRALVSADGFRSGEIAEVPTGDPSHDGWSVAWDTGVSPSSFIIGVGLRDTNTGGQVWTTPNPITGPWTRIMSTSQAELGSEKGRRPVGVAVIRNPSSPSVPIVLVALQEGRMWRKVGTGSWQPVSGFALTGAGWPRPVTFAWKSGYRKVYAYERSVGLYRSNDFGATWVRILATPSSSVGQGFVTADPRSEGRVYLATSAGVKLITNAGTAAAGAAVGTNLNFPGNPGAMAVKPDGTSIVVATNAGAPPRIHRGTISASSGTVTGWTDISDDFFRQTATRVQELSIGPDGAVYGPVGGGTLVLDP